MRVSMTFRVSFWVSCLCFLFTLIEVNGQAPIAQFAMNTEGCLSENVVLQNQSTNASSYIWDFCFKDLDVVKEASNVVTVTGVTTPTGINLFKEGNNWYGFVTGRQSNNLLRLDFGTSLDNTPTIVDLGNVGGLLDGPQGMVFTRENNVVYALLTNFNAFNIIRLSFSSGLNAMPVAENLGNLGLDVPRGLDLVKDENDDVIAAVANDNGQKVSLINFGNSILNNPTGGDVTNIPISGGGRPIGVSIMQDGGNWYGFVSLISGNTIRRLEFGTTLSASPTFTDIYSVGNPTELSFKKEGGTNHLFVTTLSGNLHQLKNPHLSVPQIESINLGRFGILNNILGFSIVRSAPVWYGFTVDFGSSNVSRIKFQSTCSLDVTLDESSDFEPQNLIFKSAGDFLSELTVSSATSEDVDEHIITIQNKQAPTISVDNDNLCVGSQVTFAATENSGMTLTSWDWDFGDGNSSLLPEPVNQYNIVDEYEVTLNAIASNNCHNRVVKEIAIFNPPTSSFTLPVDSPTCTNQDYTFTNSSSSDVGSSPTWQWFVNGNQVSATEDLVASFSTNNSQSIQLIATIPGCSVQSTQNFMVQKQGLLTDFLIDGQCIGDQVIFTNQTIGAAISYEWDFGDGNTASSQNSQHTYSGIGAYTVTLVAENADGCNNSSTKTLTIRSKPAPNFSLDLPPFSCSGTPSQLINSTPNPSDSNISSWSWNFGDPLNGTSTLKDPLYTFLNPGDYTVSLTARTNFDCSTTINKPVTIVAAPAINFTNTPTCLNQGTQFTDASGSNIKLWLWRIGNSTYTFNNPIHVFSSPGDHNVQLTVTANNNCTANVTRTIKVPLPPLLDFSVQNACEGQAAAFQNTTLSPGDPVVSSTWDFASRATRIGSPVQYAFTPANTYVVKMNSTHQSGCVYTISKNITILPAPTARFSATPTSGVPPLTVQFANQSTGAVSYQWKFNDKNNSTSALSSPSFQFNDLGDYVVDLVATSNAGCSSTVSGKISVIVPSLDIELKDLKLIKDPASGSYRILVTIKNNSNFTLTSEDVIVDISGNALIKETINATILPGAELSQLLSNQVIPGNTFNYLCAELDVVDDQDVFNNKQCQSINDGVIFSPYPNPSNGDFRFDWIAKEADDASFTIFNSMGQAIFYQKVVVTEAGLNQVRFDLKPYGTGSYLFKFVSGPISRVIPVFVVR
jgi:PKD repeat protein